MIEKLTLPLSIGFFVFILWILYLANTGQNSIFFDLIRLIPYGDKAGHIGLFGLLTLVANFALKLRVIKVYKIRIYLGSLLVSVFVMVEESSQAFMVNRTFDGNDAIANLLGIALFSLISFWLSSKSALLGSQSTNNF